MDSIIDRYDSTKITGPDSTKWPMTATELTTAVADSYKTVFANAIMMSSFFSGAQFQKLISPLVTVYQDMWYSNLSQYERITIAPAIFAIHMNANQQNAIFLDSGSNPVNTGYFPRARVGGSTLRTVIAIENGNLVGYVKPDSSGTATSMTADTETAPLFGALGNGTGAHHVVYVWY